MKIIKYNQSKTSQSGTRTLGGNGGGIYSNTSSSAPSVNLEPYALKTQILWEKGEGNNSVIEKNHSLQAINDDETAVGKYNQSISGETIFTVGVGEDEDSRKNAFAVTSSGVSAETASFDNLTSITANMGDVTAKTENVGTLTSQTITNNGLIKTNQFETQTLQAVSGYIQSLMSEEITTEYLEVTKAAHFFKLVIDEIKAVGGRLIITPASAEIHHVEELSDRFRCYFKASDGKKQIYQEFENNDQIICQTFNAAVGTSYDVSNTYYWRLCVGVSDSTVTIDGDDFFYVDLSKTDKDKFSVSIPKQGDNIVQLGNRTKEERQAAIIISAYNDGYLDPEIKAPSLVQYQGINDYSLKNHRLNVISKGLNQFKGAYLNNAGKNLDTKIDDLSTTVSDKTSDLTQTIDGIKTRVSNTETSISNVTKTVSDNKAATDKAISDTNNTITALTQTVKNNYSTLDQKADGIKATVSANTETITAQGTSISNLESGLTSTNSTITALTKTVKNNYSTLDQKADSISSRVSANTKSITTVSKKVDDNKTATDKAISDTNNTITALTQTVKNNYSTLDQKADGIKATVSANTETITAQGTSISNLESGLTSTNSTITALTKTVKDNYSTLDQKADSITSTVNSHTKTIEGLDGRVTTNTENISKVKQTAESITSTVSSMKDEIIGANCMLGLNGQGWSNNTVYDDAGTSFHCESTDWFQSHPIEDFNGDYTFSFGLWGGGIQIKILDFTQTYYDDGIYNQYVDFGTYTPCKILTTSSSVSNDTLTNYATSGTSSTWTYTNTETITLAVGDNVAVRVTNSTNNRYNSIYGTVSAINTSSKSVTVKAIALLDQPNTICTLSCPTDKKDGTGINSLHYDEKLGRYWIRFKETRGSAKTFVILFRNLSASNVGWISRLMLEESVEYPHKYNNTGQASQSMIKQTANEILMSVNNTYLKIGDGNITLNGDTKVNGSLTLNDEKQGFLLLGNGGITEISPKSIGTYNDFKSANTNTQQVVKTINCNGAKSTSDDILRFEGTLIIHLGDRKKGDFIKCKFNSLNANITNGWNGSSFSENFPISQNFSAKVMNQYGSAVIHDWNRVYSNREYTYTFNSDTANARIYVKFSGNTLYSRWKGNYNVYQGGKPMPMPNALAEVNCTLTLPTTAHMLIGYDGWGANFGNNKTVYCGKDGFIASYGDNEFRITSEGISHNNMVTTHTIIGSTSSSSPTIYEVQDPVDLVLCKSGNCKIKMPKTPYNGQTIKVLDKSSDETWIDFNGNYVCPCDTKYESRSLNSNWACKGVVPRLFTYLDNTWYEEYMG